MTDGIFRRRNLPHLDVEGKPYFVTACLSGSIPAKGLREIRDYRTALESHARPADFNKQQWQNRIHKLVFKRVDEILDGRSAVIHLADARLANIVRDAFLHFAGERYYLLAFVVMPSHHHWVFLPRSNWCDALAREQQDKSKRRTPREVISHSVQSFTGNQCNKILGHGGVFWQTETYDHVARNTDELLRITDYVEQNPVKAGLVASPTEYEWSSAKLRKKLGISIGEPIVPVA